MHAEAELANLEQKYLLTTYDVETQVYTKTESDRIDICVRYVVNPRQHRKLRHYTTGIATGIRCRRRYSSWKYKQHSAKWFTECSCCRRNKVLD